MLEGMRRLAPLLSFLLAASALNGCSGKKKPAPAAAAPTPAPAPAPAPAPPPVAAKAAPADAPAPLQIQLRSTPSGAEVSVDGQPRGTTPATVDLADDARDHEFTFILAGYAMERYKFRPVKGGVIHAKMRPVGIDAGPE